MTRLRNHYETRPDGRAGDMAQLDEPTPRLNWWVIIGWPAMFAFAGLAWWGVFEFARSVFK